MNLITLKYNCNQHRINSIAAEFPAEIHCYFISFSLKRKIVADFPQLKLIQTRCVQFEKLINND